MDLINSIYSTFTSFHEIDVADLFTKNIDNKKTLKENLDLVIKSITWLKKNLEKICCNKTENEIKNIVFDKDTDKINNGYVELLNRVGCVLVDDSVVHLAHFNTEIKNNNIELSKTILKDLDSLVGFIKKCLKESDNILKAYNKFRKSNSCTLCESKIDKYCSQCRKHFCDSCLTDFHNLFSKKEHLEKYLSDEMPPDFEKFIFISNLLEDFFLLLSRCDSDEILKITSSVSTDRKLSSAQSIEESSIECSVCGSVSDYDKTFCMLCLSFLKKKPVGESEQQQQVITCPQCKTENEKNSKFCLQCGFNLGNVLLKTEKIDDESIEGVSNEIPQNLNKSIIKVMKCPKCTYVSDNDRLCTVCGYLFNIMPPCENPMNQIINQEEIILETPLDENSKACPVCTLICNKATNFCSVCNHRFNDNDFNLLDVAFSKNIESKSEDESYKDFSDSNTCFKCGFSFDSSLEQCPVCNKIESDVNNNPSDKSSSDKRDFSKNEERISVMLQRMNVNQHEITEEFKALKIKALIDKTSFAEKSFRSFMKKIKELDQLDIPRTAKSLIANIYTILKMIKMETEIDSLTSSKCEIFLNAFSENKDTELELQDCIEAIKNSNTIESSKKYLNNECGICLCKKTMNKTLNLSCQCNICIDCFKDGYKIAINSSESLISINEFSCLVCKEPKFDPKNKNEFQSHLDFLTMLINHHLDQKDKDRFQKTLTEVCINDMSNFVWCQHGCNNGYFIENVAYFTAILKVHCKFCQKYTCFKCKEKWEPQHENRTCEEFKKFKATNGIDEYLSNNSITCPNCKTTFKLDAGACLHYTCAKCKYEFCGSCKCRMSAKKMFDCTDSCEKSGLHGHHSYNCFTYVRDFTADELADFLKKNGKSLKLKLETANTKCEFKIADTTGKEISCGEGSVGIKDGKTEYCEKHLKQHLYYRMTDEKLDPITMFDMNSLKQIVQRARLALPSAANKTDAQAREIYIEFINRSIPKQDLTGLRF